MRMITELAALATARSGSADSAAAIVAISGPTIEKITVTMPTVTAPKPIGMKPLWAVRLEKSIDLFGGQPSTNNGPSTMNTTREESWMTANHNSISPYALTDNRLLAVIRTMKTSAHNHSGTWIQYWTIFAPAM